MCDTSRTRYVCDDCDWTARDPYHADRHRMVHRVRAVRDEPYKPHNKKGKPYGRCWRCGVAFYSKEEMARHETARLLLTVEGSPFSRRAAAMPGADEMWPGGSRGIEGDNNERAEL